MPITIGGLRLAENGAAPAGPRIGRARLALCLVAMAGFAFVSLAGESPKGVVLDSDGTSVQINIGGAQNVTVGSRFRIYSPGLVVRIPLTNTVTYTEGQPVGIIRITEVQESASRGLIELITPGQTIARGYDVIFLSAPEAAPRTEPAEEKAAPADDAGEPSGDVIAPTDLNESAPSEETRRGPVALASPGGRSLLADPAQPVPGQEVALQIGGMAGERGYTVSWSVQEGWLSREQSATDKVIWVAPRTPGEYVIVARITYANGSSGEARGMIAVVGDPAPARTYSLESVLSHYAFDGRKLAVADIGFSGSGEMYVLEENRRGVLVMNSAGAIGEFSANPDLASPKSLAVFGDNLFALDGQAPFIRVIDRHGEVVGRLGEHARLREPVDIAIDREGTIYVADRSARCFHIFNQDGTYRHARGRRGKGAGEFELPVAIESSPDGLLFVLDGGNREVQVFDTPDYRAVRRLDVRVQPGNRHSDMAIAPDGKSFYVLESGSTPQIARYAASGEMLFYSAQQQVRFPGLPSGASRIAVDRFGNVLVVTRSGARGEEGIFRYSADGMPIARLTSITGQPKGMAVSGSGAYAILDTTAPHVRVHDRAGWLVERFGRRVDDPVPFRMPRGIDMTGTGEIGLLMEPTRRAAFERVVEAPMFQVFDRNGRLLRYAGILGKRTGQFLNPVDLDADSFGNIFVLDERLYRVSIYDARAAGQTPEKERPLVRGGRSPHEVALPSRIAVDPISGDFYIFDRRTKLIKKFSDIGVFIGSVGEGMNFGEAIRMKVDNLGLLWVLTAPGRKAVRIDFRGSNPRDLIDVPLGDVAGGVIDIGLDASGRLYALSARDAVYVFKGATDAPE